MTTTTIDTRDHLRTVRVGGHTLKTYWLGNRIGYRLIQNGETIFEGDDFRAGAAMSIDSDDAIAALFGFLTLRPGDTDDDYFKDYTPRQLEWAESEAEYLSAAVYDRFGDL